MRYVVFEGSYTGHCCFEYSVIDTKTPCSSGFKDRIGTMVCECFEETDADLIAERLNEPHN